MKGRLAWALIGIISVICLGLILASVFPVTHSDPRSDFSRHEKFSVNSGDAFRATGNIIVDGEVRLAFEGAVTNGGAWYLKVVENNVTSEKYQPSPNGTVYERLTIAGRERVGQVREQIKKNEDSTLVREDRGGGTATFFVTTNTTTTTEPISGTASVIVNSLSVVGYEQVGTRSSTVAVYEPRAGWYEGRETYRITGASGTVYADADTRVVQSANVSWGVTVPAGSYTEYAIVRVMSDDPRIYRITFEYVGGDPQLEPPVWINDVETD